MIITQRDYHYSGATVRDIYRYCFMTANNNGGEWHQLSSKPYKKGDLFKHFKDFRILDVIPINEQLLMYRCIVEEVIE